MTNELDPIRETDMSSRRGCERPEGPSQGKLKIEFSPNFRCFGGLRFQLDWKPTLRVAAKP